jgi:hypothetical protein
MPIIINISPHCALFSYPFTRTNTDQKIYQVNKCITSGLATIFTPYIVSTKAHNNIWSHTNYIHHMSTYLSNILAYRKTYSTSASVTTHHSKRWQMQIGTWASLTCSLGLWGTAVLRFRHLDHLLLKPGDYADISISKVLHVQSSRLLNA